MNRTAFMQTPEVAAFVAWASPLVIGERPLRHGWRSPKFGHWYCETLPDAYREFEWRFSVVLPDDTQPSRGRTLAENEATLNRLRTLLHQTVEVGDASLFLKACLAVVAWGGVQLNRKRLLELGFNALPTLVRNAALLAPDTAELGTLDAVTDMNSGFSKVYSLLLHDFPIYDSRVACALASLVVLYCQESGASGVPGALSFGIPLHRSAEHRYVRGQPRLYAGQPFRYASANVRAAWLLAAMVRDLPFAGLPPERRVFALQSALFMVGYRRLDGVG